MKIKILSFTEKGARLAEKVSAALTDHVCERVDRRQRGENAPSLEETAAEAFSKRSALLFIGAAGIAVRAIAPSVKDKLSDSPVLVMDEEGRFVISLLSGHVGGANELAREIGQSVGAEPVITTATDVSGGFAADSYAKDHDLEIMTRDHIKDVAERSLEGRPIVIALQDYPGQDAADIVIGSQEPEGTEALWLRPKTVILGIGCRRGKSYEELEIFAEDQLMAHGLTKGMVRALATIDAKKDEEGLVLLAQKWQVPLVTFTAELLKKAPGQYKESAFVEERMGVGNVCERAAALAGGPGSAFLFRKTKGPGMTLAAVAAPWPNRKGLI